MVSILYKQEKSGIGEKARQAERPAFFQDLNLDQILDKIEEDWGKEVRELYECLPPDRETEDYRRAVLAEFKTGKLLPELLRFLELLKQWSVYRERGEKETDTASRHVWFIREAWCYASALEGMKASLEKQRLQSEGLLALLKFLGECTARKDYQEFQRELGSLWEELSSFRVKLIFEKDRFTLEEGTGKGAYGDFLAECFPEHAGVFKSPFQAVEELSDLESEAARIFQRRHKEFFQKAEGFYKRREGYQEAGISSLQREIAFYASFLKFQKRMEENGFCFCTPVVEETGKKLEAKGLYDLALALVCMEEGREVVDNDAWLKEDERFFVLTGPNQGGKTTFARSLGQLIYLTKMGLDVPARAAVVPYYTGIMTHFSVEESAETGKGKLMEELSRLKPMMEAGREGAFVVINELFTTAANYDACIMGRKVLEAFMERDCRGIYVTHLRELAKECPGVTALRALVDERQVQTYRIARAQGEESAGAVRQAEKYHLTYEQIKERFS